MNDVRQALRLLARDRGLTAVSVIALGLGIGGTSALVNIADSVLLRPLSFAASERIAVIWEERKGAAEIELSPDDFSELRRSGRSFGQIAAAERVNFNLTGAGEP